jgi:DNA modification methylase
MLKQISLFEIEELETLIKPTVVTEYGQLWQLGKHRLLIGNSRDSKDTERLFDGQKATVCFTSPPYTDQREYDGEAFNWQDLMTDTFSNILNHTTPDCHILINLGLSHKNRQVDFYWQGWLDYCTSAGWPLFGMYVWDKGAGMPGDRAGRLAPSFEFVFHFHNETVRANKWVKTLGRDYCPTATVRNKDGSVRPVSSPHAYGQDYKIPDDTIRINREMRRGENGSHPAVFPVELPEFIYKTWGKPGEIVFEPFSGSGSSIIAAERTKRRCFATKQKAVCCNYLPLYLLLPH